MNKKFLLATTLMTALLIAAGCQKKPRVTEGALPGTQVLQETTQEGTSRVQQGVEDAEGQAEDVTGQAQQYAPGR